MMQRGNTLAQGGICKSFILEDIFMDWNHLSVSLDTKIIILNSIGGQVILDSH